MAAKYYGVANGAGMKTDVTTGAATTSLAVELVVADTSATSKHEILMGLEAIRQKVIEDSDPVA